MKTRWITLVVLLCSALLSAQSTKNNSSYIWTQPQKMSGVNGRYNIASFNGSPTATTQFNNAIAYANGLAVRTILEADPTLGTGWATTAMTSNQRVIDARGTTEPDIFGNFGTATSGHTSSILYYSAETAQANVVPYQGIATMHIHQYAKKNGVYNYKGASGTKTDYFGLFISAEERTVGQHQAARFDLGNFAVGDSAVLLLNDYYIGGFGNNGDEGETGVRTAVQQIGTDSGTTSTGGVLSGTLGTITGSGPYTVAYSVTQSGDTIGEWRLIRDLGSVYNTGTISGIVNNTATPIAGVTTVTVTGSGTSWSSLGVGTHTTFIDNTVAQGYLANGTNLVICFDWLTHDGYDFCVPVTAITNNTTLTINLYAGGTVAGTQWQNMATSGTYRIYGAAWPSSVDKEALTFITSDASKITTGHSFDQVISAFSTARNHYNWWSRKVGMPFNGNSYYAANLSSSGAAAPFAGIQLVGNWHYAFMADGTNNASGPSDAFFVTLNDPSGSSYAIVQDFYNPLASGNFNMFQWKGFDGTGHSWNCVRVSATGDYCTFGGFSSTTNVGGSNGQFSLGLSPVANIGLFIGYSGALGLNNNAVQIVPAIEPLIGFYALQIKAADGTERFGFRSLGSAAYALNLPNGTKLTGWSGGVSGSSYAGKTYEFDAATGNGNFTGTLGFGGGAALSNSSYVMTNVGTFTTGASPYTATIPSAFQITSSSHCVVNAGDATAAAYTGVSLAPGSNSIVLTYTGTSGHPVWFECSIL